MDSTPAPLQSLIGGFGISLAVHELLLLNGNVFGISGFIHRAVRGSLEDAAGVVGLVLGGVLVANIEGHGPTPLSLSLPQVLLSGCLVGLGTKLSNGCTSGHMISGISRFSLRSIVASATFFVTAVITASLFTEDLPPPSPPDWSLGVEGAKLLALQAIPFSLSALLYILHPKSDTDTDGEKTEEKDRPRSYSAPRLTTFLTTGFQFALALRLSNLSEFQRVFGFLLLPFRRGFDPSLAFVAGGALSLCMFLYRYARGNEHARLGGKWSVPTGGEVDTKLVSGAVIFGVGWGLAGICPGPGLVNFGRALGSGGSALTPYAAWLAAVVGGGLLA